MKYGVLLLLASLAMAQTKAATTTTLSASKTLVPPGYVITFSAVVSTKGSTPPSGLISFYDGSIPAGSETLRSGTVVDATKTSLFNSLSLGAHTITARYAGDAVNAASTSQPLSVTVGTGPAPITSLSLFSTGNIVISGNIGAL
jgi:hypothetical protein